MSRYNQPLCSYASYQLKAKLHFTDTGQVIKCKWCDNPIMCYAGIMRIIRGIPIPLFQCIICNKQTYEGQETRKSKKEKRYY